MGSRRKTVPTQHDAEPILISDLKPHPRNYRKHPVDQLAHIKHSLAEHGQYRNVVAAQDLTILAGHGVTEAATELGWETVKVVRLDISADSPAALKILTGDNELGLTAEIDDRLLSLILKEIRDVDQLDGTGYDDAMLANLLYVTRPASEIADLDEAAQWVGLPSYERSPKDGFVISVAVKDEADRDSFIAHLGLPVDKKEARVWRVLWPAGSTRHDQASLKFDDQSRSA